MEIFTLLETLEDILEKSKTIPFTEKSIVEKAEMLDIIKEIRVSHKSCFRRRIPPAKSHAFFSVSSSDSCNLILL